MIRLRHDGYTLLEMVVVLVIIGLAMGLAGSWMFTFIGSWRANARRDTVLGEIQHLPIVVRGLGRGITLNQLPVTPGSTADAAGQIPESVSSSVRLPDGWLIAFDPPLRILGNGACSSAGFVLRGDDRRWTARVEAPFCTVILDHVK
jgi:prepilin-type N-terminal cleavage/methylation domain-containing protein